MCRALTAPWVEEKSPENGNKKSNDIEEFGNRCKYYDKFENMQDQFEIPPAIYTLDDLKKLGEITGMCPYFLARRYLLKANIIVYNYAYLLDPKIASLVSAELQRDCIIVFDECHNIDNACIEAFSMNIGTRTLQLAGENLRQIEQLIEQEKQSGKDRLMKEYKSLVKGLVKQNVIKSENEMLSNPILDRDVLKESVPGNIRKAEHFIPVLRKILICLKKLLSEK